MEIIIFIIKLIIFIFLFIFIISLIFSGTIKDMFKYFVKKDCKNNRFCDLIKFIFIQYPAYLWKKPNIWKILAFPYLLIYILFFKNKKGK